MKKVQDYYFHKAKKDKYPARSIYKLEEAQKKYQLLRKGDKVLDLGNYPGSWSMYAADICGRSGLVVGVDITVGKPLSVTGGADIKIISGDIYDQQIISQLKGICQSYNVVLSDMAPKTTGNRNVDQQRSLDLARQALLLGEELLQPDGNFFCKVFEGEDLKEYVDTVRRIFTKVKIVKPKSSRSESPEVFVLGLNFSGSQNHI